MGSSSEDSDKAVSGEVIRGEVTKTEENRRPMVGAIFSRLSRLPFVNVWLRKKISTARDVVKEEKGLFDDLVDHGKSFNRLDKINVLLREDNAHFEASATATENRLAEEKRKAKARETDDAIFRDDKEFEAEKSRMKKEYELRTLEANYKIQLDPLEKAVKKFEKPEPEPKKKTTRGRTDKQKRRDEVLTRYDREMARLEAMKKTDRAKATLRKAAAAELEKEMEEIEKMP